MVVVCWSLKGGMGTTVVAAGLALAAARRGDQPWLLDLEGDVEHRGDSRRVDHRGLSCRTYQVRACLGGLLFVEGHRSVGEGQ